MKLELASNMVFIKVVIFVVSVKLMLAESAHYNDPEIQWACTPDGLLVMASFPKPFHGTIYARGYYSDPNCSTPNMPAPATKEVQLTLPLLKCGTRVRRGRNPRVRATIVIQYHSMVPTVYDHSMNISCRLFEPLPTMFWNLYRQRQRRPTPPYESWVDFRLGNRVFGEKESKLLGVSNKLFLIINVKDGGKNKDILVRKCIAHDDRILGNNTSIVNLSEANSCTQDSLSEFALIPNSSVSDLTAFAEVKAFSISTKGELYITCGLHLCPTICPPTCLNGRDTNIWSTVGTHRINKRSADSDIPNSDTVRNLQTRNNLLRSTVKVLTDRLFKLKLQQNARRNDTDLERSESRRTESRSSTIAVESESDNGVMVNLSTEQIRSSEQSSTPEVNRQGRFYWEISTISLSSELLNSTGQEEVYVPTLTSASEVTKCQNTSCVSDEVPVKSTSESFSNNSVTNGVRQIDYTSDEALLLNKSTSENISISITLNTTIHETLLINDTKVTPNCVSKLKFISVTASLSFLTVCTFLVCIGLILSLRKEQKKHLLNSYLLYNYM